MLLLQKTSMEMRRLLYLRAPATSTVLQPDGRTMNAARTLTARVVIPAVFQPIPARLLQEPLLKMMRKMQ